MTLQLNLPPLPEPTPRFAEHQRIRERLPVREAAALGVTEREEVLTKVAIPFAFRELFVPSRYKAFYGGRGSAKSHSFAEALLVKLARTPLRALCAREVQVSIRDSVKRLLDDKIDDLGLRNLFKSTDAEIRGTNGSLIIFAGLRTDPYKIKSTEGIDIAWVEEANTVSRRSLELLVPTVRGLEAEIDSGRGAWKPREDDVDAYKDVEPGSPEWLSFLEWLNSDDYKDGDPEIWFSWNPQQETDPVDEMFRGEAGPPPSSIVRRVSWRDNPWFPRVLREELEYDKRVDEDKYDHVWEGSYWKRSDARVFKNWRVAQDYEFNPKPDTVMRLGADWGFATDPTVLVRSWLESDRPEGWALERDRRRLFIDHEAWAVGCEIVDTPALFRSVPGATSWPMVADSARPETISFVRSNGFPQIEPARKGAGSVEEGVKFLQELDEILVHPRCVHVIDELRLYSYKTDPLTGKVLPILMDKKNHCIDSLRYSYEGHRNVDEFWVF